MKFFFPGMIIGILLNIFLLSPMGGAEIYPQWEGKIVEPAKIQTSSSRLINKNLKFYIKDREKVYLINGIGEIDKSQSIDSNFTTFSGNGEYFIKYQKVGKSIEFFNIDGERFWKFESREYPYISYNSKLIFLMNGDHSKIRIIDNNSNEIGIKKIAGRMSTVISFSEKEDNGAIGFLDGRFYFTNELGNIIFQGKTPDDTLVKSIAISNNGLFGGIHYGNTKIDELKIINFKEKKYETLKLKYVFQNKISLHISDNGNVVVLDKDSIKSIYNSGSLRFQINIPSMRSGFSSLSYSNGIYAAGYPNKKGNAHLVLFKEDGTILMIKEYGESFLKAIFNKNLLLLRGSDNLYCYSLHHINPQ